MSWVGQSLLSVSNLSVLGIQNIFLLASSFKENSQNGRAFRSKDQPPVIVQLFLEPSTRTRVSFEIAARRLGVSVVNVEGSQSNSMLKGESLADTFATVASMSPDLIVLRSPENKDLKIVMDSYSVPVINAGYGAVEHPTQALLDAFTIDQEINDWKNQKILFVGDVLHSRVFGSDAPLFSKLGAEVAYCAPTMFRLPKNSDPDYKYFEELSDALSWATVCIGLRLQKERHMQDSLNECDYTSSYILSNQSLKALSREALIMHPGPFVPYVDLNPEVLEDKRCRIRQQVNNGVWVRMALLSLILGVECEWK